MPRHFRGLRVFVGAKPPRDGEGLLSRRPLCGARPSHPGRRHCGDGRFVFGFDHDDADVFERTIGFVRKERLIAAQFAILTPFPGTPLYRRLEAEGRILDRDWSKYDFRHVVFRPHLMSPEQLQQGTDRIIAQFYSSRAILERVGAALPIWGWRRTMKCAFPLNLGYRLDLLRSPRAEA